MKTLPSKSVWVTVRSAQEGFHNWPEAPGRKTYLRHRHRHLFHYEVSLQVMELNRQVEFHDLLHSMQDRLSPDWGAMSCEMIALELAQFATQQFKMNARVSVFEDGECGATVEVDYDEEPTETRMQEVLRNKELAVPTA